MEPAVSGVCVEGHQLTVQLAGSGAGSITSDPPGLTCSAGTCTGAFPIGTAVELLASPATGSFLGWIDGCRGNASCALVMDRDQSVGALFGALGESLWIQQLGGVDSADSWSMVADNAGNLIVAGTFRETMTLPTNTELKSAGGTDIYVVKLAVSTGEVLWGKRYGGALEESFNPRIAVDEQNNVYVAAAFQGVADFGDGPRQATGFDIFAVKLDEHGNFAWSRTLGGTGSESIGGIAVRANEVVILGGFSGSITVDGQTLTSAGGDDIVILKVSASNAATRWVKSFGGAAIDQGQGLAIDSRNDVIVTGRFSGTVNLGGRNLITSPANIPDALLLKLTADGSHLMSERFGASHNDEGVAVAVDSEDNMFVTGRFINTVDFGCFNKPTSHGGDLSDVFLAKYSPGGACQWVQGFGGASFHDRFGWGVATNDVGEVAITGQFCGTISFGAQELVSAGTCSRYDMFAARFSADGTHLSSVRGGSANHDGGFGIAHAPDGRFFVSGGVNGVGEFGGRSITTAGSDAYIVSYAPL